MVRVLQGLVISSDGSLKSLLLHRKKKAEKQRKENKKLRLSHRIDIETPYPPCVFFTPPLRRLGKLRLFLLYASLSLPRSFLIHQAPFFVSSDREHIHGNVHMLEKPLHTPAVFLSRTDVSVVQV